MKNYRLKIILLIIFSLILIYSGVNRVNSKNYKLLENGNNQIIKIEKNSQITEVFFIGKKIYINNNFISISKNKVNELYGEFKEWIHQFK